MFRTFVVRLGAGAMAAAALLLVVAPVRAQSPAAAQPETMLVTFHVQAGKADAMASVLRRAWRAYRRDHMVFAAPHLLLRGSEDGGKPTFVEVLTWRRADIPDHMPPAVQALWKRMHDLCESRDGKPPIEGGAMRLLTPPLSAGAASQPIARSPGPRR